MLTGFRANRRNGNFTVYAKSGAQVGFRPASVVRLYLVTTPRIRRNHHYQDRVNRVLDYIGEHLDAELSLTRLSRIGCFSRFHFHRIFQGVTGETLNSHVRRVRLERAAMLMRASPEKRITDVALETGFGGTAEFSRAFKSHFNRTASSWDRRSPLENSKICKEPETIPFHTVEELERWKNEANARLRICQYEEFRYVYN